jgi:hypothetical protein
MGLGLGAVGLAIKMVVLQVVGVNIQGYVIARTNGWGFHYGYQGLVLMLLLVLSFSSKWLMEEVLAGINPGSGMISVMLAGSAVYAVLSLALLYRMPALAGLTDGEIRWVVSGSLRRLRPTTVS